jgi:hypothetical protein
MEVSSVDVAAIYQNAQDELTLISRLFLVGCWQIRDGGFVDDFFCRADDFLTRFIGSSYLAMCKLISTDSRVWMAIFSRSKLVIIVADAGDINLAG